MIYTVLTAVYVYDISFLLFVVLGLLVVVVSYCCILTYAVGEQSHAHIYAYTERESTHRVCTPQRTSIQIRTEYKNTMRKTIPCKIQCKNCPFVVCDNQPAVLQKSARRPFAVCRNKDKRQTTNGKRQTANGKRAVPQTR